MTFKCLRSDGRRSRLKSDWEDWLIEADILYERYLDIIGDSPFDFNEVSAVGFLASAASRVDYLSLNEYDLVKKDQADFRRNKRGRADLWLYRRERAYSFEFKRAWHAATIKNLEETLSRARGDIKAISKAESHFAAAGVLAFVRDEHRLSRYEQFAQHENVDFAYRIGPEGVGGGYLYFSIKG